MQIKQKIKGTLSSVFNTLSGKKGLRAAIYGGIAVFEAGIAVGFAVAAVPLMVAVGVIGAGAGAYVSHSAAEPIKKKGLTV